MLHPIRRTAAALVAAALMVGLSACSQVETASDETAIQVGGGPFEGRPTKECIDAGVREINTGSGTFDTYYYYPESQRTFDFTGDEGSDAKPIQVVSKDNQPVAIPGVVNFNLVTDCDTLKAFHNNIGRRYSAYMVNGEGDAGRITDEGWRRMMNLYIGGAVKDTLSRVAKNYDWEALYSDPTIKDTMNAAVNEEVARLVDQQTDGDEVFFDGYSALLRQPLPDEALVAALKSRETGQAEAAAVEARAVADANAAKAAADSQVAQKEAELTVKRLEADIKAAEIAPFGSVENYNNWLAVQNDLNPFQPNYGGGAIVQAPAP